MGSNESISFERGDWMSNMIILKLSKETTDTIERFLEASELAERRIKRTGIDMEQLKKNSQKFARLSFGLVNPEK